MAAMFEGPAPSDGSNKPDPAGSHTPDTDPYAGRELPPVDREAEIRASENGEPSRPNIGNWADLYRSKRPLGDTLTSSPDRRIQRKRDVVLTALMRDNPDWTPTRAQKLFVVQAMLAMSELQPLSPAERLGNPESVAKQEKAQSIVEDALALAISNVADHRYRGAPGVRAVSSKPDERVPSTDAKSDKLTSTWLLINTVHIAAARPLVAGIFTKVASKLRGEEIGREANAGIRAPLRGLHLGPVFHAELIVSAGWAVHVATDKDAVVKNLAPPVAVLTGLPEHVCGQFVRDAGRLYADLTSGANNDSH